MSDQFASLSTELTEVILSHLPIPSLLRATAVSKLFLSLISSPSFPSLLLPHHRLPWFFLHGLHNTSSKNNQSFAFDPLSNSWFRPPSPPFPAPDFTASSGFLFSTSPSFSFSPLLKPHLTTTSPLRFSRINPLIGVFLPHPGLPHFIVVAGVRFIGNLVDIEDRLAVEIYNPNFDSWELCPPLPAILGNSSHTLSSALFNGKFYVFGIYSSFVSFFDLDKRVWSRVTTLRPSGVHFGFLIACHKMLVLGGICGGTSGPSFNLWRVDEKTMEFSLISIMPKHLLYGLVDNDEDDKFASLKCLGMGNLVYVINEEYHMKYPACICEIVDDESGKCRWREVPELPSPVNKFHKVISFCSTVLPRDVFMAGEREIEHLQPITD